MARIAGLRLRDRTGGWHGEAFTASSWRQSACTNSSTPTRARRREIGRQGVDASTNPEPAQAPIRFRLGLSLRGDEFPKLPRLRGPVGEVPVPLTLICKVC